MTQRVLLWRDAVVLVEDEGGLELECGARLAPGRLVEVIDDADRRTTRIALVQSWRLVKMGNEGPRYRGYCSWS